MGGMMSAIYLAGSSREPQRIREMAARIDKIGIPITHRWWLASDVQGPVEEWAGKDALLSRDLQVHLARTNMRAIKAADVVFVLWPEHSERSTCEAEMAFALAVGKRLVVTGSRASECTWTSLADNRDASDLVGLANIAAVYVAGREVTLRNARVQRGGR